MRKIILAIVMVVAVLGGVAVNMPVMADDGDNAVILKSCDFENDTDGEGIKCILRIVVNILSVGVGVLAVLGIVITGIQYLTSSGNEEQMRKAKRRLFEIVIGLVVYVLIYAALNWLLPGGLEATSGVVNTTA